MQQLAAIDDKNRLEEIAETLIAILGELRDCNRREQERDARREAESAAAKERYARL
jgi:hypothetical protein